MAFKQRLNRKIFIGDVHGCFDELIELLSNLEYDENKDQLYFVGDLVVKGPKSNEVIEFVRTHENCHCVMGNHDYYLLEAAKYINHYPKDVSDGVICKELDDPHPAKMNSLQHIEVAKSISLENIKYLHSLPLYSYADENKNILVVHAGIIPNDSLTLKEQKDFNLMTMRNIEIVNNEMIATNRADKGRPWIRYYDGFYGHIFFGHDAIKSLQIGKYATGLETGVCYGDRLTAAIIECDEEFKLLSDYSMCEDDDAKWKKESEKYRSSTKNPFVYRVYSVNSFKVYQKPKVQVVTTKCIKLIDQLLFMFS